VGKALFPQPETRRRRVAIVAAALFVTAGFGGVRSSAEPLPAQAPLTAEDHSDLQSIRAYLNSITTMYARFQQYSSDGKTASGQLWMERPGRMRFEYDPPSPILLLADRFYVYYVDKKLIEMQKVGLQSTPAWLLLRDPITFDDLVVTRFAIGPDQLRVTVIEKARPDNGSLTMVFGKDPIVLRQWTIVDAQRRSTTVTLSNEQFGMALNPQLFVYQNPFAAGRKSDDNEN
jgi:outer membrane lipoprotein-sorting protein